MLRPPRGNGAGRIVTLESSGKRLLIIAKSNFGVVVEISAMKIEKVLHAQVARSRITRSVISVVAVQTLRGK